MEADDVADLVNRQRVREILKVSVRQGRRPKACQILSTLAGEIPTTVVSSRFDQRVPPACVSSRVRTTTSSTWQSVMVRGTLGRGSSDRPSSRSRRNRVRHLATVLRSVFNRTATTVVFHPRAHASTICAPWARPCAVERPWPSSPRQPLGIRQDHRRQPGITHPSNTAAANRSRQANPKI